MLPRGRRALAAEKPDLTTMIDVTFLLLIFFMCIRFRTLDAHLSASLPPDGTGAASEPAPERVSIRIDVVREGSRLALRSDAPWPGRGAYRYGEDRALVYTVGPHRLASLAALEVALSELHRADSGRGAVIDARPGVIYEDVVAVVDTLVDCGYREIAFRAGVAR
jgi:biopolymer transport protein ExbD